MTRFFRLIVALFALGAFASGSALPAAAAPRPSCCGSSCPMPKKAMPSKCCHLAPAPAKAVVLVSAPAALTAHAVVVPAALSVSAAVIPYSPRAPSSLLLAVHSGLSPPAAA